MKLRNKKTGEVLTVNNIVNDKGEKAFSLDIIPDGYELIGVPLIKVEKVRKAVKLCAEIWEAKKILVIKTESRIEFGDGYVRYVSFTNDEWADELKDITWYTIAELCGESDNA